MRLRTKLVILVVLAALLPALVLAGLSLGVVRRLADLAGEQSRAAMEQEARQRLVGRAVDLAHINDVFFGQVRRRAEILADYVQWLYRHPDYYPPFLPGGTPLERAAGGHLVNAADTPVGVFVSPRAVMNPARWQEVGLLSQVDPFLMAMADRTPYAARIWIVTATGIARAYPNPGLGHPGSPVGPQDDPRDWVPFRAAAPESNPGRHTVWTAPYLHPADGHQFMSAVAPIWGADGNLLAVAGLDMRMADVVDRIRQAVPSAEEAVFLAQPDGRLIAASNGDLAPTWSPDSLSGLGDQLAAVGPAGVLTRLAGSYGPSYLALARLPEAGWVLGVAAPAAAVDAAAEEVRRDIRAAETRLVRRWQWVLVAVLAGGVGAANLTTLTLTRPIARLVEGTRRLAEDLSHRLPVAGRDELADLARAMNETAGRLEISRGQVAMAAQEAGEERQRLLRARQVAVLEERNRLAREIHDTLAQGLTGMVLQLDAAEDDLVEQRAESLIRVRRARDLARDSLQEARRSVWNLRPHALELGGLAPAIASLARGLQEDGVTVDRDLTGQEPPPLVAEALYRIAQEAVANIRRHSGATRVELALTMEEGFIELRITDNGKGFKGHDPFRPGGGFGLWAMRARAEALGGQLTVTSRPGEGTSIAARLPRERGEDDAAGDKGPDR